MTGTNDSQGTGYPFVSFPKTVLKRASSVRQSQARLARRLILLFYCSFPRHIDALDIVGVLVSDCDDLFLECACISGAFGSGAMKHLAQIRSRGIAVNRDTSVAKSTSIERRRRLGWRGEKVVEHPEKVRVRA